MFILVFCARCFMALIRGSKGNFPCPVCLVPKTQMTDGSTHPLRTSETMQQVYNAAAAMSTKKQQDSHLKNYGLRNVEVREAYLTVTF